ncbi:hypothetical protein F511_46312 [Dorcoceras hygrometricum]|uniref:Uncharacterized protein n=1 Tax=Dorcoceras hygrometricum TaxID=472368 RepID=A0A2Z6ZTW8_9LAMI|nr:hypothetical protein F511_46312 [Dorcoceras hygrometricum]
MAARSTAVAHPYARLCRRSRATHGARQRACLSNLTQPVRKRSAGTAGQLVAITWLSGAINARPRAHNRARPETIFPKSGGGGDGWRRTAARREDDEERGGG